jgi:hypothetical protein
MDLVCYNCGHRLGQHYCNHDGVFCERILEDKDPKSHACPVEDKSSGQLNAPKPYGQGGWFIRQDEAPETEPVQESVQNAPVKDIDTNDWKAWRHNVPGECACGILRQKCDYHK